MTEQDRETLKDDASELRCIAKSEFNELEHGTRLWMGELASRLESLASRKPPEDKFSLLRTWWAMLEAGRDIDGDPPLTDDQIVLNYSGNGAGVFVTVGDFRKMFPVSQAIQAEVQPLPAPPEVPDAE